MCGLGGHFLTTARRCLVTFTEPRDKRADHVGAFARQVGHISHRTARRSCPQSPALRHNPRRPRTGALHEAG